MFMNKNLSVLNIALQTGNSPFTCTDLQHNFKKQVNGYLYSSHKKQSSKQKHLLSNWQKKKLTLLKTNYIKSRPGSKNGSEQQYTKHLHLLQ